MSVPARAYLSIGEVLTRLRSEFPDVTISKIRFLESEGLIEPQRTPSGYRKFTQPDVDRLRYVLSAQKEQYLPLRVIKENLDAMDRGLQPSAATNVGSPRLATINGENAPHPALAATNFTSQSNLRLTRSELLEASQLSEDELSELERYGLINSTAKFYDGDALLIARTVKELSHFGVEARHLRAFKTAADREIGLIEQIAAPHLAQKGSESAARAQEVVREFATISIKLHAALVASGLHQYR
jgi:DNA-binding transcriptional MerR regulator